MGPFLTAIETGLPVFPTSIIGTRSILHPDSWILRRGSVVVRFLPAIECKVTVSKDLSPWQSAILLRDAARGKILEHCGEVDLIEDSILRN
jgi:1-acyl-sn-glycerol-3-phosphate acyltransferase